MKKALSLAALLALTGACRRHTVTIDSSGNTVAVDGKSGQVTVKTDRGTTVYTAGAGASLPAGFPSDVPVYPGATVTAAIAGMGQPDKQGQMITFETKDSAEAVANFYKSKLSEWQKSAEVGTAEGKMLVFESADSKRTVTLLASSKPGKTTASLTVAGS